MKIKITHQVTNVDFEFEVDDSKKLTSKEVSRICQEMNVQALFVEGKYYKLKNN